jgi:two-component system chemotaxis response regulator CheB
MALRAPTPRAPTRVMVVDDSVVVRRVVARALDAEPSMELAGIAANGRIAIDKLAHLRPDVVVLDLDMPEMNGYETLAAIRSSHPDLPVIVFSHLTAKGAAATLEALALGATGFALKPRADGIGLAEEQIRTELLPLVAAVAARPSATASAPRLHTRVQRGQARGRVDAVVVGVSTGGPNALAEIVPGLPVDLPVPVLIVQHMPPVFTKTLAERLDRLSALGVTEAAMGEPVVAGRVYIAPGGRHMAVAREAGRITIVLHDGPPENSCRPAADVLFRSAADVYGRGVLGVVLTGMGRDGLRGSEAVCASGGNVLAQTEASSVVGSMPAAVAHAGLADAIVPLEGVAAEIVRRVSGVG